MPGSLFKKTCRPEGLGPVTLLKKRLRHRCFPVNFPKSFFKEDLQATTSVKAFFIGVDVLAKF